MIGGEPYTLGLFDTAGMSFTSHVQFLVWPEELVYCLRAAVYILLWDFCITCQRRRTMSALGVFWCACFSGCPHWSLCSAFWNNQHTCFMLPRNVVARRHLTLFILCSSRSGRLWQVTTSELPPDRRLPCLFLCCVALLLWKRQRKGKSRPWLGVIRWFWC